MHENGEFIEGFDNGYYSYGSEEEAFLIIRDFMYILGSVPMFVLFMEDDYRKESKGSNI